MTNDYAGSQVYKNLICELDKYGVQQTIYSPIRNVESIDKNKVKLSTEGSKIIYSHILNTHTDRAFYKRKVKKILTDVEAKIDFQSIECVHAHTWYSDGGVAYELYKKYNIPYIIAIRNTDLNLFWKLPHLKKYGLDILKNASRIILISKIYENRILLDQKINPIITSKYNVIPNGIDDYWVRNRECNKQKVSDTPQLLFIGKFSRVKNVTTLIHAVEYLEQNGIICELNLVGGGGKQEVKVLDYIKNKRNITYHGKIMDKDRLKEFYRNADIFTMPSKSETFGLVYLEALSQGIPVVFTKNEGIDGLYSNKIGEAVDCNSAQNIAEGIKKIILNYDEYSFDYNTITLNHDWKEIALEYLDIYTTLKNEK
ncbi:glycosyltransferase family 4 protein [Lishizhenia tianjinensis]|uniref:glycosyltransferase family 4 protein n=1 Tax=Lishizhenia tianjinensis TaxID=477690 RepID=UPI00147C0D51|nr:glycosyltransferase family 4 protein [Lishizhenia tianjinensis]